MKLRLLAAGLALLTSSCGLLPSADGWPTIFPDWESDPLSAFAWNDTSSSPEVVIGDPPPGPYGPDAPPDLVDADAGGFDPLDFGGYDAPVGVEELIPRGEVSRNDEAAEPGLAEPTVDVEPPSLDAPGAAETAEAAGAAETTGALAPNELGEPLRSATVLDAPLDGGLTLANVFASPADGVIRAVIVSTSDGTRRIVSPTALDWTSAAGPRLAAPIAPRDARALFAAEDVVELAGFVSSLTDSGAEASLLVRDDGNLLHRVAVPAGDLLARAFPSLKAGAEVVIRAAPSRDDGGKVWVPTQVQVGDVTLKLRDEDGNPLEADLLRGLVSARELIGSPIRLAQGEGRLADGEGVGADWTLSPDGARLETLELDGEGLRIRVPWDELPADWYR